MDIVYLKPGLKYGCQIFVMYKNGKRKRYAYKAENQPNTNRISSLKYVFIVFETNQMLNLYQNMLYIKPQFSK